MFLLMQLFFEKEKLTILHCGRTDWYRLEYLEAYVFFSEFEFL